ncbi:hypothetical protein NIES39_J03390 [Arthrospira platensis NIES-39]|nr:hypothetical protein NIES39_J03390 [Arthrospira platensis NIES-39]
MSLFLFGSFSLLLYILKTQKQMLGFVISIPPIKVRCWVSLPQPNLQKLVRSHLRDSFGKIQQLDPASSVDCCCNCVISLFLFGSFSLLLYILKTQKQMLGFVTSIPPIKVRCWVSLPQPNLQKLVRSHLRDSFGKIQQLDPASSVDCCCNCVISLFLFGSFSLLLYI